MCPVGPPLAYWSSVWERYQKQSPKQVPVRLYYELTGQISRSHAVSLAFTMSGPLGMAWSISSTLPPKACKDILKSYIECSFCSSRVLKHIYINASKQNTSGVRACKVTLRSIIKLNWRVYEHLWEDIETSHDLPWKDYKILGSAGSTNHPAFANKRQRVSWNPVALSNGKSW